MSAGPRDPSPDPGTGLHVGTLVHDGRIWEAFLEFEDDPRRPTVYRGRLRFDPTDGIPSRVARTTVIIIEDSYEEAVHRTRSLNAQQLQGLLRSCLPEPHE